MHLRSLLFVCTKPNLQTFAPTLKLIINQVSAGKGNKLYICESINN